MYVIHSLEIDGDTVNESVAVYDSAVAIKPREAFPRSYPVELLRDPFRSAAESLSIGAARALGIDKNARITFSSNIPGAAELFAAEWVRG